MNVIIDNLMCKVAAGLPGCLAAGLLFLLPLFSVSLFFLLLFCALFVFVFGPATAINVFN